MCMPPIDFGIRSVPPCGDPIVVGQIMRPNGNPVTFFLGWWLDTSDL